MDSTTTKGAGEAATAKDERASASLRALVEDAQQLLDATARAGDEGVETVRRRLRDEVRQLRAQFDDIEADATARLRHAARRTDHAVHDHPYGAMGAAALAGLLLGVLIARR
jgi:uncharacterized protein (TIGR03382 family)